LIERGVGPAIRFKGKKRKRDRWMVGLYGWSPLKERLSQ